MTIVSDEFSLLTLTEIADKIKNGSVSSLAVTEAQLRRIARLEPDLHAYAQVMETSALEQAKAADKEIAAGGHRGPLHGVPIAVKDLCWIEGVPTRAGTLVHGNFVPGEDATVVRRLRQAGAIIVGKTQMTEGAYSDYHPAIAPSVNPWHADYWAGISSSGSAVATAAGLCFGAIASDTGGSIRWPAAANGVTGLKPTWGRVSRHGVFDLAPSLDHIGTIARSAMDAGILLAAIAGSDPKDPTAAAQAVPDFASASPSSIGGLRIGFDPRWNSEDVEPQTQAALAAASDVFTALGAHMVEIRFPDVSQAVADWVPNCAVEAAAVHERDFAANRDLYGPILAGVIEMGKAVSEAVYQQILLRRTIFRRDVEARFASVDMILTPVQPFAPLTLATIATLGEQPDLIARLQRYTCPLDMSGHPALTFPAGIAKDGMPIGLQLLAGQFQELTLVRAGAAFQGHTAWHKRHPGKG
ncbi:amidase (plasmid) [Ensifer sp. PDNC004]|uniref:amidase n=1 Tax=Ensifer sp. PDNC004 TaxID=2811423 RepID=UPI00196346C2|nr:amidase [Ensifer sp. PDNC004]QRY70988.1 amidase [Ensifer sp. PDNC004]